MRIVAAIGLMLVVAATAYALSHGRVFLFPFLVLLGFPMAAVFRNRRPPPGGPPPAAPPPQISLN